MRLSSPALGIVSTGIFAAIALTAAGCDTGETGSSGGGSKTTGTTTTTTGMAGSGGDIFTTGGGGQGGSSGGTGGGGAMPGPACGDGKIDPGEACDDGNGVSGDGCTGTCDAVESGFACPMPGQPCVTTVICGDGKITGGETCDDQNTNPGDGCDATCHVETGWVCLVVGAACAAASCGDGIVAGDEKCDDGNGAPGDGCSATCHLEPGWKCPVPGQACSPTTCGDGVAEGTEQCDDGDNDLGDGCTPFCVREPDCSQGACTSSCGDGIKLPNGNEECEDGNTEPGDGCSPDCKIEPGWECTAVAQSQNQLELPIVLRDFHSSHPDMEKFLGVDLGIVQTALGADGKPEYAGNPTTPTTSGKTNFDQWYRDVAGVNFPVVQTLTLNKLPTGEYQFSDSSFFPLTNLAFGNEGNATNFHFTSEVRYWFEYKGTEQLDFTGDDDVWVFVNKKLAVNLGGVHGAMSGGITLDAAQAGNFNLIMGNIYEIVVFQAERHTSQSNYKLTLSDFANSQSICMSVCGDGIKTPDEVCDDGVNDGTYGHCTPDCKPGPYCGDATVQPDHEECDDGVNLTPYGMGCAPGCKKPASCGDGNVDSLFGEQCDDGNNNGGYNECAPGCILGPRCGDGVLQADQEECDDGNKSNNDGCDNNCTSSIPQ